MPKKEVTATIFIGLVYAMLVIAALSVIQWRAIEPTTQLVLSMR